MMPLSVLLMPFSFPTAKDFVDYLAYNLLTLNVLDEGHPRHAPTAINHISKVLINIALNANRHQFVVITFKT